MPHLPQPHWTAVLSGAPPSGVESKQLTTAYGRHVTYRLDGISDAQFFMDGHSSEAALITELSTDLILYRRTQAGAIEKMYRGRIITETDDVTPDNHTCQFSTNDYRGMLQNRVVGIAGRAFAAVDAGLIAYTLISESQALLGGNWTVTNGAGASAGVPHTIAYDPGSDIMEMITNLAHRVTGAFEWEIDANLALNRYYPTRGSATGAVLDFGGIITHMRKTLTSTGYGNAALLTGDGTTTIPVIKTSGTIGTDVQGRWERFVSFSDIKEQATLDQRALWTLGVIGTLRPQWVVTLAPGRWDKATMWLGDTVKFVGRSGRLQVNALHRIIEVGISIDEDGLETVQLGLLLA